jgi:hypothetical protein
VGIARGRDDLGSVIHDKTAWQALLSARLPAVANFLLWAAACEGEGKSLRLARREDLKRCEGVIDWFDERWWGVVVYSCFDSCIGTEVVRSSFSSPLPAELASVELARLRPTFPRGSVQHHRAQATLGRAISSLESACRNADSLRTILIEGTHPFDERFQALRKLHVAGWGRTTNYDALLRAGALCNPRQPYAPDKAYLLGSTGPSAGFAQIWGLEVSASTEEVCEGMLRMWTNEWQVVCDMAGVRWTDEPYGPGDFENSLCVYQEPPQAGWPEQRSFESATPVKGPTRKRGLGPAARGRC